LTFNCSHPITFTFLGSAGSYSRVKGPIRSTLSPTAGKSTTRGSGSSEDSYSWMDMSGGGTRLLQLTGKKYQGFVIKSVMRKNCLVI